MNGESMREKAKELLQDWLFRQIENKNRIWFEEQILLLRTQYSEQALHVAFSLISRRFAKGTLELSENDLVAAEGCIAGWKPNYWSLVDSGRILLLAELPSKESEFASRFHSLFQTADVFETISLYRGLPLYPDSATLEPQVGEGLRTNIRLVFEAIAHRNPYPKYHFDTNRWNNMILKALFISCPLAPIDGLDERANVALANTLLDFAHERWAAGRQVPFELWRCVGPFACGSILQDLDRVISSGSLIEQQAVALAISVSPDPTAAEFLKRIPEIAADIAAGNLTWDMLK